MKIRMSKMALEAFKELMVALSPENLSHDGERTPEQIAAAKAKIELRWKRLECRIGATVFPEDITANRIKVID